MSFQPDAGRLVAAVIPAKWLTTTSGRTSDVVVVHDMESPEGAETAESVSRWAQTLPTNRKASWHYAVDTNSIVQCVRERDVAYAAPGANHNGIHIEHAGVARQSRAQWFDQYSRPMLELSAKLAADICRRHNLPAVWLTPADLLAGRRGITSHANVTAAFHRSTHTDPGPGFPADWYVARIRDHLAPPPGPRPPWVATVAGGREIGTGSLLNPLFIRKISAALRSAGKRPPYTASTPGIGVVATGKFWPPGAFTKAVSAQLRAGRPVHIDDVVTITPRG